MVLDSVKVLDEQVRAPWCVAEQFPNLSSCCRCGLAPFRAAASPAKDRLCGRQVLSPRCEEGAVL